ncbi:hypothetical protein ANN_02253 [Periplaneta americana]|uniref:Uncharacterized protein n=1 Tax=Periplaneta americana TaxID=6978 RepID=A0ABQ8TVV5_PERAM|nr:hypothetical protein ANN_02253 [Periplaneta americana]
MADLYEGGNEPPCSLTAICKTSSEISSAASARPVSQLPALGLAASSSTAAEAGPLRVTVHYHHHPAVNRATSSGLHRYTRSYSDNAAVAAAAGRGVRRVRFELPPKPPPPVTLNSGAASGRSGQHRPSAGVESWLRSRATSSLFSPSHEHQLKHGATEGRTLSSRVVIATTAVSATPRIHDTEGYRRGTLPPTSPGAACPGPNCSPEAAALLKAARDGDEKALNDILRAGVREEDLNCQDASGKKQNYRVLVGRPEGKRPLGRPKRRWENNIKIDFKAVGYDGRDLIILAQDRERWRAYLRVAMNHIEK